MENQIPTVNRDNLPVYPDYAIVDLFDTFQLMTFVRKQYEGVWYIIGVRIESELSKVHPDRRNELKQDTYRQFIAEVYKVLTFYKIDLNCSFIRGHAILQIDENQESEEKRLLTK